MKNKDNNKSRATGARKDKSALMPEIASDIQCYFRREEAKITSSGVMKGGLALITLGLFAFPEYVKSAHENVHVNFNTHASRGATASHISVAAINQHASAGTHSQFSQTAHSNQSSHVSTAAVDAHNNANIHASAPAVASHTNKPAIDVAGVHANQGVTKGNLHNSGSLTRGKHTAMTAHTNQAVSAHASTGASTTHHNIGASSIHSSVNAHGSAGAIDLHRNHSNAVTSNAVDRHASYNRHASAAAADFHTNVVSYAAHSHAVVHGNHDSHGSW